MKRLGYFSVLTCFLAANLFAIKLGSVQLSLYRASLFAGMLLLLFPLFGMKSSARIPQKRENSYSLCFMLLWFCWGLLSFLWVKDFSLWMKAMYFLGTGVFWSVYYSLYFHTERDFRVVLNLMQLMILCLGCIGWYEVLTKDYRFIPLTPQNIHAYIDAPARVPIALSGNPNDFALLVLFGIFLSWICFQINKGVLAKALSLLGMLSAAGLLLFTESRANLLGLVLGGGMLVFLLFQEKKRRILLCLLGGVGIGILVSSPLWGVLLEKMRLILQFNFQQPGYNSESVRVNLLINGLHFLLESCWFGVGAGNIEYWMAHDTLVNTNGYVNIHNWWMELLASYGAILFVFYCIFYCNLFRHLLRKYQKAKEDLFVRAVSGGFLCCMAAFVVASISSSSNMKTEWLWVFWAVVIAFEGYDAPQAGKALREEGEATFSKN